MGDKLTWQMAADYLEEKGFDEQATALRVFSKFDRVSSGSDAMNQTTWLRFEHTDAAMFMGDYQHLISLFRDAANNLERMMREEQVKTERFISDLTSGEGD